jgi:hypothetical protein
MNSATAAVTATADRKQSEGVRSYEEGRYEEALLSECSSPFDLSIQTYRDFAECSDAKHVLYRWRKWLFVAEGHPGHRRGLRGELGGSLLPRR